MSEERQEEMRRWEDVSQEYEERWRQHGYLGMRWEGIMPGTGIGYEIGVRSPVRGPHMSDVEQELGSGYRPWAEGYGVSDRWA